MHTPNWSEPIIVINCSPQVDSYWKWVAWRLTSCETSLPSIGSWWGVISTPFTAQSIAYFTLRGPCETPPASSQFATIRNIGRNLVPPCYTNWTLCSGEWRPIKSLFISSSRKVFRLFYFYVHIYSGYLNCSFGCHPQMLDRLITQLVGVML